MVFLKPFVSFYSYLVLQTCFLVLLGLYFLSPLYHQLLEASAGLYISFWLFAAKGLDCWFII